MLFKGFEGQATPHNHIDIRITRNMLMFLYGSKTMPHILFMPWHVRHKL